MLTVKQAEHILRDVHSKHNFKLHMGSEISSLKDMAEAIDIMADRTFVHHVNEKKNDFAYWIKEAIGDDDLACKVEKLRTREALQKTINKRVKELEQRLESGHVTSRDLLNMGALDFILGMIVGVLGGIILATLL